MTKGQCRKKRRAAALLLKGLLQMPVPEALNYLDEDSARRVFKDLQVDDVPLRPLDDNHALRERRSLP